MSKEEKKKCYISGKITGLDYEEAQENFRKASLHARFLGYEPVNPINIVRQGEEPKCENQKWVWYMKSDLKEMMDCDAILLQENWKDSKGAIVEHNLAKDLDFTMMYMGKHKNLYIDKNYDRNEILLKDRKDDKKIFVFLFFLISLITLSILIFPLISGYLFK